VRVRGGFKWPRVVSIDTLCPVSSNIKSRSPVHRVSLLKKSSRGRSTNVMHPKVQHLTNVVIND
jgi:hypothetical protein